jgi:catechol 2,3-dioxygenase-like lactoylglutathione lyase family enzyme
MDLNHLHLLVRDLEASARFYGALFGFRENTRYGPGLLFLRNDAGFDLALTPAESIAPLPQGIHFGFAVPDRERLDSLYKAGLAEYPACFPTPVREHGTWANLSCHDPDGYVIEIYWDPGLS